MTKFPYFRWFPKDFESDENARLMTLEEAGLYLRCLNHAWLNDGLPTDTTELARLFSIPQKQFDRAWGRVAKCFKEVDGRLWNSRQEQEREYAKTKSARASDAVRTRYSRVTDVERPKYVRSTDDLPRAYGSVSGSEVVSKENSDWSFSGFDAFWKRYPQKIQQDEAARMWISVIDSFETVEKCFAMLARYEASEEWAKGVYKRPARWLQDGHKAGWTDEPPPPKAKPNGKRSIEETYRLMHGEDEP